MATFLFTHRIPSRPPAEALAEVDDPAQAARTDAWRSWFDRLGAAVVERGDRVSDARTVGVGAGDTRIGGYSIVTADDMDAAVALAKGCPGIALGGGVEVGQLMELGEARRPIPAGDRATGSR